MGKPLKKYRERMLKLADKLDAINAGTDGPVGFNLGAWYGEGYLDTSAYKNVDKHWCNTTACLAGHAALMAKRISVTKETRVWELIDKRIKTEQYGQRRLESAAYEIAQSWLGLNSNDAYNMFKSFAFADKLDRPIDQSRAVMEYPPDKAAKMLRHFAETGLIVWP